MGMLSQSETKSEVGERKSEDRRQRTEDRGRRGGEQEDKKVRGVEVKQWPRFHSTFDITEAAEKGLLPDKMMINTHPQRWTDKPLPWLKELVFQNTKNIAKMLLNKARST